MKAWADYKSIKQFYSEIDSETLNNPLKLAEHYVRYIHITDSYYKGKPNGNSNIYIVSDDKSLEYATKRTLLISDKVLLSNHSSKTHRFLYSTDNGPHSGGSMAYENNDMYVRCSDFNKLGKWLKDAKQLIISDKITYIPNTFIRSYGERDVLSKEITKPFEVIKEFGSTDIADAFIENKRVSSNFSSSLKNKLIDSSLKIELPIVDEIDMYNYSNITMDNLTASDNFRLYLTESLLSLNLTDDLMDNERKLKLTSIEITKKARDVKLAYKNTLNKYLRKASTYSIATISAYIVCINSNILNSIKSLIGTGTSGLIPFINLFCDYLNEKNEFKGMDTYYLILLEDKSNN